MSSFSRSRSSVHSVRNLQLRALLLGRRCRDEVGARPTLLDDLAGDAVVVGLEVVTGLGEGRVDDRVLDDDVAHPRPCAAHFVVGPSTADAGDGDCADGAPASPNLWGFAVGNAQCPHYPMRRFPHPEEERRVVRGGLDPCTDGFLKSISAGFAAREAGQRRRALDLVNL